MIKTEQTVSIGAPIEAVWTYVSDIRGWATLMPGYRDCTLIDENNSRWTLKVGVGGMVRTVNVLVDVATWDGPNGVDFAYLLEGDPVSGSGTYRAVQTDSGITDITLKVQVVGSGPLAPMWEAMGKPLLPQFAKAFAQKLKAEIEARGPLISSRQTAQVAQAQSSALGYLRRWLIRVWRKTFGSIAS